MEEYPYILGFQDAGKGFFASSKNQNLLIVFFYLFCLIYYKSLIFDGLSKINNLENNQ
jgi:hypothetical protein